MSDISDLVELLKVQVELVSRAPKDQHERMLANIHSAHHESGLKAGLSEAAALKMADQIEDWIRGSLRLKLHRGVKRETFH